MKDIDQSRLASTLTLLVGIWVAVSPAWITMSSEAQLSTLIVGIVMIGASFLQYFVRNSVPSWINGIAAAWLLISVFAYGMSTAAVWSAVISAIAIVLLAWWDGVEMTEFAHHEHTTT